MKRETIKELGKLSFDVAKILLAIGFLQPIFGKESFSYKTLLITAIMVILIFIVGGLLFNRGVKNDE
jgi:hypothetical protein